MCPIDTSLEYSNLIEIAFLATVLAVLMLIEKKPKRH
jgi:hypothetical protein